MVMKQDESNKSSDECFEKVKPLRDLSDEELRAIMEDPNKSYPSRTNPHELLFEWNRRFHTIAGLI